MHPELQKLSADVRDMVLNVARTFVMYHCEPGKCDCNPSMGTNSCAVCDARALLNEDKWGKAVDGRSLTDLKTEASRMAQERGHTLGFFQPSHHRGVAYTACTKCGMFATVDSRKDVRGARIGGSSVLMECTGQK
jgi:hypothetical protein